MLNWVFNETQYLIVFQEKIVRTLTYEKTYELEGKENGRGNFCFLKKVYLKKKFKASTKKGNWKMSVKSFFVRKKHIPTNKLALFLNFTQN